MSFRLQLQKFEPYLACVVGKDGRLYFRSIDVAIVLKYSDSYSFARRHFTALDRNVLPATAGKENYLSVDHFLNFARRKRSECADRLEAVLKNGRCNVDEYCYDDCKCPLLICCDDGDTFVPSWISSFAKEVNGVVESPPPTSSLPIVVAIKREIIDEAEDTTATKKSKVQEKECGTIAESKEPSTAAEENANVLQHVFESLPLTGWKVYLQHERGLTLSFPPQFWDVHIE